MLNNDLPNDPRFRNIAEYPHASASPTGALKEALARVRATKERDLMVDDVSEPGSFVSCEEEHQHNSLHRRGENNYPQSSSKRRGGGPPTLLQAADAPTPPAAAQPLEDMMY